MAGLLLAPCRIKIQVGEAVEGPPEVIGKWFVNLTLWNVEGDEQIGEPFQIGPFDTQAIAEQHSKQAAQKVGDEIMRHVAPDKKGKTVFLDMKNGGFMPRTEEVN